MKKICLLSDTHGYLPVKAEKYLEESDEIWHAGDIGHPDILMPWEKAKILRAVFGNIDNHVLQTKYSSELLWNEGRQLFYMTHIGGRPRRYPSPIKKKLTEHKPDVFICGHSHILKVEFDKEFNMLYMNPGACGREGFHKTKTLILFDLYEDNLRNLRIVELEPRSA